MIFKLKTYKNLPRVGDYFMYSNDLFKIIRIDENAMDLAWYDEDVGDVKMIHHFNMENYLNGMMNKIYTRIDPITDNIMIPDVLAKLK